MWILTHLEISLIRRTRSHICYISGCHCNKLHFPESSAILQPTQTLPPWQVLTKVSLLALLYWRLQALCLLDCFSCMTFLTCMFTLLFCLITWIFPFVLSADGLLIKPCICTQTCPKSLTVSEQQPDGYSEIIGTVNKVKPGQLKYRAVLGYRLSARSIQFSFA